MNLFIDTPQRAAERLERDRLRALAEGQTAFETPSQAPRAQAGRGAQGLGSLWSEDLAEDRVPDPLTAPEQPAGQAPAAQAAPASTGSPEQQAAPTGSSVQSDGSSPRARRRRDAAEQGSYSVAEDAYRREKDYDRRRARRRKLAGVLRMVAMCVLLPCAVVAVFLVSYALTCILNGASPDELALLMGVLFARVEGFARDLFASL